MDDVRLMPTHCHMEKIFVHPGNIIQFHPKKSERYHDSSTILREHPGIFKFLGRVSPGGCNRTYSSAPRPPEKDLPQWSSIECRCLNAVQTSAVQTYF